MTISSPITITLDRRLIEHPQAFHLRRMRAGIWLYLELLARQPAGADSFEVEPATIGVEMGLPEGTVRSWLGHLRKAGYLDAERLNGHVRVTIRRVEALTPPPTQPNSCPQTPLGCSPSRACRRRWGRRATTSHCRPRSTSTRIASFSGRSPERWPSRRNESADHEPRFSFISSNAMRKTPETILALDPGLRELGYAVLVGRRLAASGVLNLKDSPRRRRLAVAREHIQRLTNAHQPTAIVVEKTHPHSLPWLNDLHKLTREVRRIAAQGQRRSQDTHLRPLARRLSGTAGLKTRGCRGRRASLPTTSRAPHPGSPLEGAVLVQPL
ncbi:MAG: crossover junction endodeoxyribonuclease RuvC [Betaproteobacteria bacterium]|nr:crossover junction endodeoxyribonuclease RuvC [Betaproteobacteria bacterium]